MTTYAQLARELGFGEDFEGFRTWADMHDVQADQEADADTATMLREAMAASPEPPADTETENRHADHILDELTQIVDNAGYDDEIGSQL